MSERLEIIKFLRESEKTVAPGMQPSELISRKDVDWLIKQAERVQELESESYNAHLERLLDRREQQNKRYREALEKIARINIDQGTVTVSEVHAVLTAREALEGDSNEPKQSI